MGLFWRLARSLFRAGRKASRRARREAAWAALQDGRTVPTRAGLAVRSPGERRVADLLDRLGIPYDYERPMHGWYPDFYLPRWDLIIEYWGSDPPGTPRRKAKVATYLRHGHNLIHLEKEDFPHLEDVLLRKLYRFDQGVYDRLRAGR